MDSCRVDAPRDTRWNFGNTDYGGGSSVPGRRQFRLYASREGEVAQNDAERGAGRFTEALLGELGGRSVRESVSGLPGAALSIHRAFQELRERGEGWQLPQFIVDRDWDACSFLDDDLSRAALPRAAKLDQAAWDGLGTLFEGRELPRCAYEAYAWAFKAAGCTTPAHAGLPGRACWRWSRTWTSGRAAAAGCRWPCPSYGSSRTGPPPRATRRGRTGSGTG